MDKFRLNLKTIFGDYFFLVLLLLGIGVNYYFEMKVNRSLKQYTANHEAILKYQDLESQVRNITDQLMQHEHQVRAMMISGNQGQLSAVNNLEDSINRNAILFSQRVDEITPVDHLLRFREAIQSKLEYEHALISQWQESPAKAWKMIGSDKTVILHRDIDDKKGQLLTDIQGEVAQRSGQAKKDKLDIISLDYAIPHLTSFIFLVFAAFTVFKIFQVSRLNRNLKLAIANEQKAQNVKDQFMDTMTHELRSPLNSVLGYTNLLLKTKLDTDQQKYIKSIKTSGELLLNVINEVLDYSKIRSGYIRIASSPFKFRDQISALADIVRDKVNEKALEFTIDVDEDIPDHLRGDSVKLLQVLLNLTYNAVKFTQEGKITVTATCKEIRDGKAHLLIDVADTGIGMAEDKLPRIFERFYQVEGPAARNLTGTGLGLSITREMLMMQGGSITVESTLGKGSVFHVYIPYEVVDEADEPKTEPAAMAAPVPVKKLPAAMHVLAVDDNALNRDMLGVMLKGYGVQYTLAGNGPEAIRLLRENIYDVVLMDLQMPGMDGKEAARKIRGELKLDVPIIALSAFAEASEKQNSLAAGMDAYLTKPIRDEELLETLEFYTPQPEHTHAIDLEYLRKVASGNSEFIESVVMRVADTLPKEISKLRDALMAGEQQAVNETAHDMKTTFAVLGVYEVLEEPLNYLESWKPSPKNIGLAGEMFHRIETIGEELTQQLTTAFSRSDAS